MVALYYHWNYSIGDVKMKITNVNIYHENHVFQPGCIEIQGETISAVHFSDTNTLNEEIIDGQGCYAIPGLVDIHFMAVWAQTFVMQSQIACLLWQNMRLPKV